MRKGYFAIGSFSVLLACRPAGAAGESDLLATGRRFEALKVGASSVPVRDLRIDCGHVAMTLKSGNATPVRAGDEIVGLFFEGVGAMEYRSVDPIEFPISLFEVKRATGLTAERSGKDLVIRDAFQRLLWLSAGRPLPDLPGGADVWNPAERRVAATAAGGPSLEAAFRTNREKFSRVQRPPIAHAFIAQRANAPTEPLVVAELEGGKEDLRYVFDAFDGRSEALLALRRRQVSNSELRQGLYPIVLSDQPIGRDRREPMSPPFFLSDVRVDVTASDGKDVALSVQETIIPQGRPLSVARFDLESRTFAFTGVAGIDSRSHRVRGVSDGAGKALPFHHAHGEIIVGLLSPAPPDRPVTLRFEIEGDFLIRPGGDNFWLLGVEPWFPQPDLGGQFYTFHARVKVKKPFVPFAPGKTIARGTEGDSNFVETDIDKPIQFAIVLAGRYEFDEETREGFTVRVASYAGKNSRAIKQLTNLTFGIIDYYQKFLGPFPFQEFNIIEINSFGFGQAPPATMFITKEAFNPLLGETNQFFSEGVNERFAHEIAHQYWGHAVKMPSEEEQWLTEAFAEYSAAIFLRDFRGKGTYNQLLAHWKRGASEDNGASPIPLVGRVDLPGNEMEAFRIRQDLLYWKGSWLLAAIHKELGDETFLTFLKSYQKTFLWKFGSTKHVAGLLQFMTKKDWMPFFEKYYWGTEMP
jgi:hypothetical protein